MCISVKCLLNMNMMQNVLNCEIDVLKKYDMQYSFAFKMNVLNNNIKQNHICEFIFVYCYFGCCYVKI